MFSAKDHPAYQWFQFPIVIYLSDHGGWVIYASEVRFTTILRVFQTPLGRQEELVSLVLEKCGGPGRAYAETSSKSPRGSPTP